MIFYYSPMIRGFCQLCLGGREDWFRKKDSELLAEHSKISGIYESERGNVKYKKWKIEV